jgi:hypothetical protein
MDNDPYLKKNRDAIKKCKTDKERTKILESVYQDGYSDGLEDGKADKEGDQ